MRTTVSRVATQPSAPQSTHSLARQPDRPSPAVFEHETSVAPWPAFESHVFGSNPPRIQRKVAVGRVNDPFEREADAGSLYVGSPETVAKRIARTIIDLGPSRFDMKYSAGALSHERLMRSIDLYASSVVPRARQLITAELEIDPVQVFSR